MQLTEEQKQRVSQWIADGMKLADVQRKLADDFDVRVTYMEARFIVDDLKLTPLDPPEPAKVASESTAPAPVSPLDPLVPSGGGVVLKVDEITRPGTLVSGTVTFSDGGKASWHLDQMGRLGMHPETVGYHPPDADVETFQIALEKELVRLGM